MLLFLEFHSHLIPFGSINLDVSDGSMCESRSKEIQSDISDMKSVEIELSKKIKRFNQSAEIQGNECRLQSILSVIGM